MNKNIEISRIIHIQAHNHEEIRIGKQKTIGKENIIKNMIKDITLIPLNVTLKLEIYDNLF